MSNTYNAKTKLWVVTDTGDLQTSETTAVVVQVVYMANTADDDLVIHDGAGNTAFVLKAGSIDASPVRLAMEEGGRRFEGLKIQTIDSGTAYIYLSKG